MSKFEWCQCTDYELKCTLMLLYVYIFVCATALCWHVKFVFFALVLWLPFFIQRLNLKLFRSFSLVLTHNTHTHTHEGNRECLVMWYENYSLCFARTTRVLQRKRKHSCPLGGGDSSVVRVPDSWLKGRGFESLLKRRENFLLQGRLSVLTLISVSFPPPCYHSST